jgi:hypothetical protein
MNKYKYFFKSDPNKEAIGVLKAKNEKQAYLKAAKKKQLPLVDFINIFGIKEIE